jgi:hypothetical protein
MREKGCAENYKYDGGKVIERLDDDLRPIITRRFVTLLGIALFGLGFSFGIIVMGLIEASR